ncbi:MAG: XisI protein [Chloroflexales bacterium]|nr:XisI protein [Chloroflexales bacterium]
MDTRTSYREIVKDVISKYARLRPSHGAIRLDTVFDEQQDHYALMQSGWDRGVRVRGNLIYVTLRDNKVHIEYDGIEHGISDELIRRGVPKEKIVLAFLSPSSESELVPA